MSQPNSLTESEQPEPLPLKEVVALLVKYHSLHEGLWDLALEVQVGIGQFGPSAGKLLPGAMIGVSRIGLTKSQVVGPNTVNAAEVNPAS